MLRVKGMRVGQIVGFVPKSELERLRLIREARAIYDSIFPSTDTIGEPPADLTGKNSSTGLKRLAPSQGNSDDGVLLAPRQPRITTVVWRRSVADRIALFEES